MSSINDIKQILKIAHLSGDAVLLEGLHGIGKSATVQQFADDNDMAMFPLFLSTQETGDLIGIPNLVSENGTYKTVWAEPEWLQNLKKASSQGKHCVLFLDELNRAPLDVRQAALQLVLEGKIHSHELPVLDGLKTLVVGAINPSDGDYQVQELDAALLDRFVCITVDNEVQQWLEYARETGVLTVIRDFIAEFPDRLHMMPEDGSKGSTNRAWIKVSDLLKQAQAMDASKSVIFDLLKGRLGSSVGAQFFRYYTDYKNIIKTEDIVEFIKTESKKNQNVTELGELIKDKFSEIEAIRKHEIASELVQQYSGTSDSLIYLSYLYSLEMEIVNAFLKKMKSDKEMFGKIVKDDDMMNNKQLFRKIVDASRSK